jgi:hypothetical protein
MLPRWMIDKDLGYDLALPTPPDPLEDGADPAAVEMNKAINEFSKKALEDNAKNLAESVSFVDRAFSWLRTAYGVMLGVGLLALLATIVKGLTADSGAEAGATAVLGGVSVGVLVSSLVLKPTDSMERNAVFAPWMLMVLNTYWTRLVYMNDPQTIDSQLQDAASDAADQFKVMSEALAQAMTTEKESLVAFATPAAGGGSSGSGSSGDTDGGGPEKDGAGGGTPASTEESSPPDAAGSGSR